MTTSLTQEELTKKVMGGVLDRCSDCVIMVLPDHPTPIPLQTHTADPVPFAIHGHGRTLSRRLTSGQRRKGRRGCGSRPIRFG